MRKKAGLVFEAFLVHRSAESTIFLCLLNLGLNNFVVHIAFSLRGGVRCLVAVYGFLAGLGGTAVTACGEHERCDGECGYHKSLHKHPLFSLIYILL